jgi:hypothetical protein
MTAPIDVRLRAEWIIGSGYRYDELLGDEVIVNRSRDPESEVTHRYVVRVPTPCRDLDEWMRLVAPRRDGVPSSERPPLRTIDIRRD